MFIVSLIKSTVRRRKAALMTGAQLLSYQYFYLELNANIKKCSPSKYRYPPHCWDIHETFCKNFMGNQGGFSCALEEIMDTHNLFDWFDFLKCEFDQSEAMGDCMHLEHWSRVMAHSKKANLRKSGLGMPEHNKMHCIYGQETCVCGRCFIIAVINNFFARPIDTITYCRHMSPLLLSWFNFNPSMDK